MPDREWDEPQYATSYLEAVEHFPHRLEGEGVIVELVPADAKRILDLGTGDGRILDLIGQALPDASGIGLDVSPPMLAAARQRFAGRDRFEIIEHDLAEPLPSLGSFDVVVSSFAIHHLEHERKKALYAEIVDALEPGGTFMNFEHVASTSPRTQLAFIEAIGETPENVDPSDKLLNVEGQLVWLRELGLEDADCYWKWREFALLSGIKPRV